MIWYLEDWDVMVSVGSFDWGGPQRQRLLNDRQRATCLLFWAMTAIDLLNVVALHSSYIVLGNLGPILGYRVYSACYFKLGYSPAVYCNRPRLLSRKKFLIDDSVFQYDRCSTRMMILMVLSCNDSASRIRFTIGPKSLPRHELMDWH